MIHWDLDLDVAMILELCINHTVLYLLVIFSFVPSHHLYTTGIITLSPDYGSVLGGSSILVSGPYFTVQEEDTIECMFDDSTVDGIFVSNQQVLCVSPSLSKTGRVPFQLLVTGGTEFVGQSMFVSRK